jgi:hypothetical protein
MRLTDRILAPPPADRRPARAAARRDRAARAARAGAAAALAVAGVLAGCAGDGPTVSLKSDDVAGRIPAMKRAAGRHDRSAAPELVAALGSDDPAERMFAIRALREITGQTFGYNYYEDDAGRAPALQRWKDWLSPRPPATGPATGPAATMPKPDPTLP